MALKHRGGDKTSKAAEFWENVKTEVAPPLPEPLSAEGREVNKALAEAHKEMFDKSVDAYCPEKRISHFLIPQSHDDPFSFPEEYMDGVGSSMIAQGIITEGAMFQSRWINRVESGKTFSPADFDAINLPVEYMCKLLRGGVTVTGIDVVFKDASGFCNPEGVVTPQEDRIVGDDFRNLLWATKMSTLDRPHIMHLGAKHIDKEYIDKEHTNANGEGIFAKNPSFHTVQDYLEDPKLRKERWGQYTDDEKLFSAISKHVDLDRSMYLTQWTGVEHPDSNELRIKVRKKMEGDISKLPYVKPLLEKAHRIKPAY